MAFNTPAPACACTEDLSAGTFALTAPADKAYADITEYGLVRVSGQDAVRFLHGQFTNAVQGLGSKVRAAAYCSPKGRMLATLHLWADGDDILMMLPKAVAPAFIKRLRMYVLRDDVTFACAMDNRRIVGLTADAADQLTAAGLPVPADGEVVSQNGVTVVAMEPASAVEGFTAGGKRAVVLLPADSPLFAGAAESALWWASEIAAGAATVWPATRELFVPQAVNYERTGGVIFNKGCYPGQEVIARVQHIGQINRRAGIFRLPAGALALPGAPVFANGEEAGFVVESVTAEGCTLLLVSALRDALAGPLTLTADGASMAALPLPYALEG